jgi:hypothetical protein
MTTRSYVALSTFLLLTVVRAADIATTLHFDRSLAREGNPIVFMFGGGLRSLVLSTGIVWLICAAFLLAYWRGDSLHLSEPPKRLSSFVRAWIERVIKPRRPLRSSLPGGESWHEGLQAIRFVGLALPWAVIVGSASAVHAWFATYGTPTVTRYQAFYSALTVGNWNYFVWLMALIGFVLGASLFSWSEFREVRQDG